MRLLRAQRWCLPLVGGVCLVPALSLPVLAGQAAYVAELLSGTVTVIDSATNTIATTVSVGLDPDGIAATPDGQWVYVANFRSASVSVIDTRTNRVATTIPVGDGPVGIAITPNGAFAYVANKNADTISVIDTHINAVTATINAAAGDGPDAVAITPDGARAYVTNSLRKAGTVSVIDTGTNQIVASISVGDSPGRVAIAPQGQVAYVTNFRSASVSVIDTSTDSVRTTLSVDNSPSGVAFNTDASRAYVATVNDVAVLDAHLHRVIGTIPLSTEYGVVAIAMSGTYAYVTNLASSAVTVIDTRTNAIVQNVCVVSGPFAAAIATIPDTTKDPFAKIIAPAPGFKLRPGRSIAVKVVVRSGAMSLQQWMLRLLGAGGAGEVLVQGTQPANNVGVATIAADDLQRGQTYTLVLDAQDTAGNMATDRVSFLVPDPQYTLIPLEPGNFSRPAAPGISLNGAGNIVAFAGSYDLTTRNTEVLIADVASGVLQTLQLPLFGDFRLARDGLRLDFAGPFLGIYAWNDGTITQGPGIAPRPFNVDQTGLHIVFQDYVFNPDNPDAPTVQFFYDDALDHTLQQLTHDPQAIDRRNNFFSSTPLISSDGMRVVFASRAMLGVAPPDTSIDWRIFSYDVSSATLHQVIGLPQGQSFDVPVMSGNGQWLTFVTSDPSLPDTTVGARIDLNRATLQSPIGGVADFSTSDAAVSGDGSIIVLSTRADLDPQVGNADHNEELFAYDVKTGAVSQISETIGGTPAGGTSYRPAISDDAGIVAFSSVGPSGFTCPAAAEQRAEADGFFLGRVRAVRVRPGNHAPKLHLSPPQPPGVMRVLAGQTLTLTFAATDADGDPIFFFAQLVGGTNVPPGSAIEDHRDGRATFRWATTLDNEGVYPLRVAAFDAGGGEAVQSLSIAVCGRIVSDDGNLPAVLLTLFEPGPPPPCVAADLNQDDAISAADAVAAVRTGV